jgi:hypothetical protein
MFIIILWFVPLFDDGLMTSTFWDYLYYDDAIFSLVNVKLLISISYSLSRVFCCNFLVTTRKVKIFESYPARDRAERLAM